MHTFSLRAGLAAAFTLCSGLAHAAPVPTLDKDPAGFLRYVESSPSPAAKAARQKIAAGPAALARERALAQKEGLAVVPAQLNRPLPPDDQNAAPLYLKAAALRRGKLRLPNYAETLSARYTYTPEQLARVQKIYDDNREAIALLHQATDRPQCVFARDWTKDTLNAPFQQYAGLRESARELRAESVLLAEEGRYSEAIANQTRVYRVAEHAASDPTLISYLVAEAIDAIATSGMQDILTLAGPNADIDAQVGQAVTEKSARLSLRHALSGEVALGDAGLSLLRHGGPAALGGLVGDAPVSPPPSAAAFTPPERRFYANLLDAAEADYIHQMRAAIRLAETPEEVAAFARASRETPTGDLVQEVTRRLSPLQFESMNDVPQRSAVGHQITRTAAAVLAERAKTGAYPDRLPGTFTDPYTGRPLGYRREGTGGFVVYSAGPGGHYDGGTPDNRATYDKARNRFRYPAVPVPVPPEEQR
jgi:hypothetical protein